MSTDKTTPTVGKLLTGDEPRDAIHFALAPVMVGQSLQPGSRVCLNKEGSAVACKDGVSEIGIIDPFLPGPVKKGQRCWLFLLPNTITNLRHEWTHPAFPDNQGRRSAPKGWGQPPARNWRGDATVQGIFRKVIEDRDYALLPILADALEDAGCGDEKLLRDCRIRIDNGLCWERQRRVVTIVESAEKEQAILRIDEIAELLGKRWADLCISVEGSVRQQTAGECAAIAERWGDVQIRDAINETFGLDF